ncbi:MAG: aminotransferase class V-fold PLP-dependent enzyme [Actinobacteria bacterium]|nr:aminotransferase class V-fold PLP-dependent enzyme [Actinomycetota bacterium]MCG2807541.1 aminotransferase class V-fold PLP-dependent enzyme [Coriobacteriia bacterium]
MADTAYESALAQFLGRYEGYAAAMPDEMRASEYARLDSLGHTYLDYTGGGLYAESQLRAHHELLSQGIFGNPHSHNPTSLAATKLVEEARDKVLAFFNADPDEYDVVFTMNASGALKLIGESYPFEAGSCYLLSYDNHNSVNGIREFARRGGAQITYVPVRKPELRLDEDLVRRGLTAATSCEHRLFAYPAQSNFSGVKHPLEWIDEAQDLGWDVLLDCAAFVPTNRLDLSVVKPEYVPISFYKMFGYPTGSGALIARHEALAKLRRPWFAGGTITLASVQGDGWFNLASGHTGFEDGTVDYLGLPAVRIGLEHLERIGIENVHARVVGLADWLLERMSTQLHSNGAPMFRVFGPETMDRRGATIAFYLLDPEGAVYDVYRVEEMAGGRNISVRTGCFCNPGDGEVAHDITPDEMSSCFSDPEIPVTLKDCQRLITDSTGKVPNTIRVSLGIASDFADVWRFSEFCDGLRDVPASKI